MSKIVRYDLSQITVEKTILCALLLLLKRLYPLKKKIKKIVAYLLIVGCSVFIY